MVSHTTIKDLAIRVACFFCHSFVLRIPYLQGPGKLNERSLTIIHHRL
jgi:hypothetical protein